MAKEGLIDTETLAKTFKYIIVLDWEAFEPAAKHILKRYNLKKNEIFSNFQWLASRDREDPKTKGKSFPENNAR